MKRKILSVCAAIICTVTAQAQMAHYYIGSNRNEVARSVKTLDDGSSIIAGYIYDLDSNNEISDADNLLLRVNPNGTIAWQQQWGTDSNDMLYEMIITQNQEIVVVGTANRGRLYEHNHAAIYRFDQNGNMLFKNYIRNINNNQAGEVFKGVAETTSGDLVAVGSHDSGPATIDGLISFFRSDLTHVYTEVLPLSPGQSDAFTNVVADDSDRVYIIGYMYRGAPNSTTYYDQTLMYFDPYTGPLGTINWLKYYDIAYGNVDQSGTVIDSDWPVKVFLRNSKILITALVADGWSGTAGNINYIFRCNTSGFNPEVKLVRNGVTPSIHSNSSMIIPITHEEMFITNVPGNTGYDFDQIGVVTGYNTWVTDLLSYTASAITKSVDISLNNNESIQSLDIFNGAGNLNGYLYMAGNAQANGSNNNDIFFSIMHPSLEDSNAVCPIDTTTTLDSVYTSPINYRVRQDSIFLDEQLTDSFKTVLLTSVIQCGNTLQNKNANLTVANIASEKGMLVVAPNPSAGIFNVFYPAQDKNSTVEIVITNMQGQIIHREKVDSTQKAYQQVNIGNKAKSGVYVCSLIVDGQVIAAKRVTIAD